MIERERRDAEMKLVRMSTRGRVTIPSELRDKLGLKPGDRVGFTRTDKGHLLQLLRETLLDLKGSVEVDKEQDFESVRGEVLRKRGNKHGS